MQPWAAVQHFAEEEDLQPVAAVQHFAEEEDCEEQHLAPQAQGQPDLELEEQHFSVEGSALKRLKMDPYS